MALNKDNRITKDKEYKFVFKNGRNFVSDFFICKNLQIKSSQENIIKPPYPKFGIIASKKVGNAVKRNRAKRILSESLRNQIDLFRDDLVATFICRARIVELSSKELEVEIKKAHFLYKKTDS